MKKGDKVYIVHVVFDGYVIRRGVFDRKDKYNNQWFISQDDGELKFQINVDQSFVFPRTHDGWQKAKELQLKFLNKMVDERANSLREAYDNLREAHNSFYSAALEEEK